MQVLAASQTGPLEKRRPWQQFSSGWEHIAVHVPAHGCRARPLLLPSGHYKLYQLTGLLTAQVVICHNHVGSQHEIDVALIHELIHAYDHCRGANLDWSNCEHHACSEVRFTVKLLTYALCVILN